MLCIVAHMSRWTWCDVGAYTYILAWAGCVAYLCEWAMREPGTEISKKYRLPRLFVYQPMPGERLSAIHQVYERP